MKIAYHKTNLKAGLLILQKGFQASKSGYYGSGLYAHLTLPPAKTDGKGSMAVTFDYSKLVMYIDGTLSSKELTLFNRSDSTIRHRILKKYGFEAWLIEGHNWLIVLPYAVHLIEPIKLIKL